MRVALLTNFIPPYRKSLYTELDKDLDTLTIFISQEMEKNRNWKVDHGDLNVLVQKGFRYTKRWKGNNGYNEKSIVQIPYDTFFKLRRNNPDIVISCELGMRSLLSTLYCKLYRKPLILWLALSEHTEKNKKGLRLILRKVILKRADAVLCNARSGERYVESISKNKKIFFAPYTSDFELSYNIPIKKNVDKTILFTGQLIERKGIIEMVSAIQKWSDENRNKTLKLVVVGDGPERAQFNSLSAHDNIKLNLLGTVAYEKLQDLYQKSDIYIFPTLADEWGVVVNEALASGLPILGSTYSQAVEELIVDNENGWTFQPDNCKTFVEALTKAIDTPNENLHQMGQNGVKKMGDYTAKSVSENIHNALNYVSKHYK